MPTSPLLVIYTGGTLGMQEGPRGLVPGHDFEARLRRALATLPAPRRAALADFEMLETATPIDSSGATPADWSELARLIARHYRDHAGVVVLHGTDTLAWTASSLAYQLHGIDRPVVVTGAMQPLESPGSDALDNIEAALRFAAMAELREVALCFAGRLLRGTRSRKWQTRQADAFISPNHPALGEFVGETPQLYTPEASPRTPRFELPDYTALAEGGVPRLVLWPGISAWQLESWLGDARVKGALLEIWGAGNVPADPALHAVLARASEQGKLMAAISQCPHGRASFADYAAGSGLVDAGVLDGADMTPEAAVTKLVHLLAQPLDDAERRRRFLQPRAGERSD